MSNCNKKYLFESLEKGPIAHRDSTIYLKGLIPKMLEFHRKYVSERGLTWQYPKVNKENAQNF
jgi:hypothetical protein